MSAVVMVLSLSMVGTTPAQAAGQSYLEQSTVESAVRDTRSYVLNQFTNYATSNTPLYGTSSEWMLLSLARDVTSGESPLFTQYKNEAVASLKANDGSTPGRQVSTDYERIILALTAMGYDATSIAGYNLFDYLSTRDNVSYQGINGVIFALLAVEANPSYTFLTPSDGSAATTIPGLIDYLLSKNTPDGGWALYGTKGDVDITSMALQALAPFKGSAYDVNAKVSAAIDKALTMLSARQGSNGEYRSLGFGGEGDPNSNSQAQVVTAMAALNVSPTDPRFVKNGHSVIENMLSYHVAGSGYKYLAGQKDANGMATEQCYYATIAYQRQMTGRKSLYNMSDVTLGDAGVKKAQEAVWAAAAQKAADEAAARAEQQASKDGSAASGSQQQSGSTTSAPGTAGSATDGTATPASVTPATGINSGFDLVVKENSGYTRAVSSAVTNTAIAGSEGMSGIAEPSSSGAASVKSTEESARESAEESAEGTSSEQNAGSTRSTHASTKTSSRHAASPPISSVVSEPATYRIVQRAVVSVSSSAGGSTAFGDQKAASSSDDSAKKTSDPDGWSFSAGEYESPSPKKAAAALTSASAPGEAISGAPTIAAIAVAAALLLVGGVGGGIVWGRRSSAAAHSARSRETEGE
ncbi:MAG: hypothetical protein LKJ47_06580 [Bifidobacteriaceae bacterium]|jgi:hypothetical protein|nr:hypothetical protein [Bifidobacteriaceae bacterium]